MTSSTYQKNCCKTKDLNFSINCESELNNETNKSEDQHMKETSNYIIEETTPISKKQGESSIKIAKKRKNCETAQPHVFNTIEEEQIKTEINLIKEVLKQVSITVISYQHK